MSSEIQAGLTQKDLAEIGAQSVVSAVLSGKRQLCVRPLCGMKCRRRQAVFS